MKKKSQPWCSCKEINALNGLKMDWGTGLGKFFVTELAEHDEDACTHCGYLVYWSATKPEELPDDVSTAC